MENKIKSLNEKDYFLILKNLKISVIIPCYNEEVTIVSVVEKFHKILPGVPVYIYDNNSTDQTVDRARKAGAIVRAEALQGKGHVVRRMFSDIDADLYILIDGDATYDVAAAPEMIRMALSDGLDMVNGARVADCNEAYRRGHIFGNKLLTGIVASIFGRRLSDMLSGYRVFSRRFVKSFPALSSGFEIETELTVHALELSMPVGEMPVRYIERPPGSVSKLKTYRDGFRIVRMIFKLVKQERPLFFFSAIGICIIFLSIFLGTPVIIDFFHTGLVKKLPTAVLSTGLMILGFFSVGCGLILDSVALGRREVKRLAYLAVASLSHLSCDIL
ncbi:glycosyltransferase family 2 protein [Acetobacter thailandicus]|uniref:glycosyltransferase family 2 protein n=1 Tax=Acetobacter thailandicus TaxID=1502842 RepID=UPI001BA8BC45|nr:glycosyltransferase family 2 protein [Acetobacter thailandicus]MBS0987035.1 glycosyltransferase [Acetobacter thailandicus]